LLLSATFLQPTLKDMTVVFFGVMNMDIVEEIALCETIIKESFS